MQIDLADLDRPEIRSYFFHPETQNRFRVFVEGVKCSKCIGKLNKVLQQASGVQHFEYRHDLRIAELTLNPSFHCAELAQEIKSSGFHFRPLLWSEKENTSVTQEKRMELVRLGVAFSLTSNIMMFALADYFGASAHYKFAFSWLQFALYLPFPFFVLKPLYLSAWQNLKNKEFSLDLSLTIASLLGFLASSGSLLMWTTQNTLDVATSTLSFPMYFDSLSSFLTLILATRFVQSRLQKAANEIPKDFSFVRQIVDEKIYVLSLDQIQVGMTLELTQEEFLPVESQLKSHHAYFDASSINGEPEVKLFTEGMVVPSGYRLRSGSVLLETLEKAENSNYLNLLNSISHKKVYQNNLQKVSDSISKYLIQTVFAIAAGFVLVTTFFGILPWSEALYRAFALTIIACPCAMAFGIPLIMSRFMLRARSLGFIVREADIFSKINQIQSVCFDKTGTLTEPETLVFTPNISEIPSVQIELLLALESYSNHPIANKLRLFFTDQKNISHPQILQNQKQFQKIKEIPGQGISGLHMGNTYEVSKSLCQQNHKEFEIQFKKNEAILFKFSMTDSLKPNFTEMVEYFYQRKIKVAILTGDNEAKSKSLFFPFT
ncbi:MAG: HAD-IC family P-type ATPase, partial [Pseudobdellovibrionaceae bacterium]